MPLKYTPLSFDELVINTDRLSRFKLPEESFSRVFGEIILKHLIEPKYSKKDFFEENAGTIAGIVQEIWNFSVKSSAFNDDTLMFNKKINTENVMLNSFQHLTGGEYQAEWKADKTLKAEKADGIYAGKREPLCREKRLRCSVFSRGERQRSEVMTGASAKRFQEQVQGDMKLNNCNEFLSDSNADEKRRSRADSAQTALRNSIYNTFKNIDEKTRVFINTDLILSPVLQKINYDTAPLNLKFLIMADKCTGMPLNKMREKYSLCFPAAKLLIVEGITEEILLPVFADKLGRNFNKNGIFVLGAGGKSKSPAVYAKLKDRLNIPAVMLFDRDAQNICRELEKNLLKKDKYILIEKGEFEDILPVNLLKRALDNEYSLSEPVSCSDLTVSNKMCENIENFYRTRHLGEFKKSKLAKITAENVKDETDITKEIRWIINSI